MTIVAEVKDERRRRPILKFQYLNSPVPLQSRRIKGTWKCTDQRQTNKKNGVCMGSNYVGVVIIRKHSYENRTDMQIREAKIGHCTQNAYSQDKLPIIGRSRKKV